MTEASAQLSIKSAKQIRQAAEKMDAARRHQER